MIYGSLLISGTTKHLSLFKEGVCESGSHTEGRERGHWYSFVEDVQRSEVFIPQRDKHLIVHLDSAFPICNLTEKLEDLDSQYEGSRHVYKLWKLQQSLPKVAYAAQINCKSNHGWIVLLSHGKPIHMVALTNEKGHCQLVWSTEAGVEWLLRSELGLEYVFYRFPTILDRPLFLNTQPLCSHWWRWKSKGLDTLRALNAMEVSLFKDPSVENFDGSGSAS